MERSDQLNSDQNVQDRVGALKGLHFGVVKTM